MSGNNVSVDLHVFFLYQIIHIPFKFKEFETPLIKIIPGLLTNYDGTPFCNNDSETNNGLFMYSL